MNMSTKEYAQNMARIRILQGILAEHNAALKQTVVNLTSMKGLANAFNKFAPVIFGTIGTITGLAMATRRVTEDFAQFDDKLIDVMKVTGLTRREVSDLSKELQKIDTRTSQEELLDLAYVAGKLGITGKADIMGFVNAADKIVVALSKDLGGNAEEAIRSIGKAVEIFNLKQVYGLEGAMLRVGSAINELGMASVAQEGYLVTFLQRLSGVAPMAKISIQDILGLAATLDIYGQSSEVAGTAYSKLMSKMASETETMAKIMGISIKDYIELFSRDANEAMLQLFDSIRGEGEPSFVMLVDLLAEAGVDAERMRNVIGALVQNISRIREQQEISNQAFEDGTGVVKEFNIKNTSAQAILEKKQKQMKALRVELGEKLLPVYMKGIDAAMGFTKSLAAIIEFIMRNFRAIATLTAGLLSYIVVLKVLYAVQSTVILTGRTWVAIVLKVSQYYHTLTGNITRAAAAQRMFNMLKMQTPWVALAAAITAATIALIAYMKTKREVSMIEKARADVQKQIAEEYGRQTSEVDRLRKAIENEALALGYRKTAIEELKAIIPDYHGKLDDEGKLIDNNVRAINAWIEATRRQIILQANKDKYAEVYLDQNTTLEQIKRAEAEMDLALQEFRKDKTTGQPAMFAAEQDPFVWRRYALAKNEFDRLTNLYKEQGKTLKALESEISVIFQPKVPDLGPAREQWESFLKSLQPPPVDYSKEAEESELQAVIQKRLQGKYKENEEQFQKDLDNIQLRYAQLRMANADKTGEEWLENHGKYLDKRLEMLIKDEKRIEDLIKTGAEISDIDKEKHRYHQELREKGLMKLNLTELEAKAELAIRTKHQKALNDLDVKAFTELMDARKDNHEQALTQLRYDQMRELEAITTFDQAKALLQSRISKDELEKITTLNQAKLKLQELNQNEQEQLAKEFIEDMLADLQLYLDTGYVEGIIQADNILSEEEKKIAQDRMRELLESLVQLGIIKKEALEATDKPLRRAALRTDILGFAPDDWEWFFNNLDLSKLKVEELADVFGMAAQAIMYAWSDVNNLIVANENRALQQYESNMNKRQKILDKQLENNLITQEDYNQKSERIEKQVERQKAIVARKQAIRERAMALASIAQNTAVAIMKVWGQTGVGAMILKPLIIATAAIQAATVLSQPLPEIPGLQMGGQIPVTRSQDGRRFNAAYNAGKRGFVNRPTVIVGEKPEYVVPHEGLQNPTLRPIIEMIELARINKNLSTIDMRAVMPAIAGRQEGGYVYQPATTPGSEPQTTNNKQQTTDPEMRIMLKKLIKLLEDGIPATLNYQDFRRFEDKVDDIESKFNI